MSSPQGGEAISHDPHWSPYGELALELGSHAYELSLRLRAPHGDVPTTASGKPMWTEDDNEAFGVYCDFRADLGDLSPAEGIYELLETVDRLHAALPFSEGERRWLIDTKRGMREVPYAKRPKALVGLEAIVTSNGLRQVVQGQELVRRWAAFRRSTDEFAHLGTVDEAIRHAQEIARRIQPNLPEPDETSSTPAS
jgi:hypothetical protein